MANGYLYDKYKMNTIMLKSYSFKRLPLNGALFAFVIFRPHMYGFECFQSNGAIKKTDFSADLPKLSGPFRGIFL